jgi:hypothetical protein
MRVFLGGTCNGSLWRLEAAQRLDNIGIGYFDPVVDNWGEVARQRELLEREECDFCLYVITPKMTGVYAVAEVVDDSNKRPEKTLFVVLGHDEDVEFTEAQRRSLDAVKSLVAANGGHVFDDLESVAKFVGECR